MDQRLPYPSQCRPRGPDAGFTAIELLACVAIMAILASIAVPSFRELLLDSRRSALTNELLTSVQLARSEALKRGTAVTVCPSVTGASCSDAAADWARGWIVFSESAAGGTEGVLDAGEPVLRFAQNPHADTVVRAAGTLRKLSFRPFNRRSTAATLAVCDRRGDRAARWIVVSPAGRARVATGPESPSCP